MWAQRFVCLEEEGEAGEEAGSPREAHYRILTGQHTPKAQDCFTQTRSGRPDKHSGFRTVIPAHRARRLSLDTSLSWTLLTFTRWSRSTRQHQSALQSRTQSCRLGSSLPKRDDFFFDIHSILFVFVWGTGSS